MALHPFSQVASSIELPGQTIENSVDRVTFYGVINAEITRDKRGLALALDLMKSNYGALDAKIRSILLEAVCVLSETRDLPQVLPSAPITTTTNPFA